MKEINIALLGFGNVGRAFVRYMASESNRSGVATRVTAVADSSGGLLLDSPGQLEALLAHKESGRSIKEFSATNLIGDSSEFIESLKVMGVSVLVESLPTNLLNGQPALGMVSSALNSGVNVVTVDKGPLVHGFSSLAAAARAGGSRLGFSGTTGVRPPEEISGERVLEIRGVLNGTTNYILTEMQERAISFERALDAAREAGIAEPDPSLDIEGWDTASKILILAKALMGADAQLSDVSRIGISPETESLIEASRERGGVVRLVGRARIWQGRIRVSVAPKILTTDSPFYSVAGMSKAATFRTATRGEIFSPGESGRDAISRTIIDDVLRVSA